MVVRLSRVPFRPYLVRDVLVVWRKLRGVGEAYAASTVRTCVDVERVLFTRFTSPQEPFDHIDA